MANRELIELTPIIVKLAALLGAALMLERFLTFFNKALNRLTLLKNSTEFHAAKDLKEKQNTLAVAIEENEILLKSTTDKDPREIIPNSSKKTDFKESNFDVVKILTHEEISDEQARFDAQLKETNIKKEFWMQILGTLIAITGCYITKFSVWTFITDLSPVEYETRSLSALLEFVFTGIIIGAGSKPINFLMNFLMTRKLIVKKSELMEEIVKEKEKSEVSSPAPSSKSTDLGKAPQSIEEIVGFTYDEGDRPERLEHTHRFTSKIDLITYHHTCFHSDAPYIELTKEFDRKGWLTGYHCVVFKDGTIRVICRWDRFGNHAVGHNGHSMGLAFQGNFETDQKVPNSNVNGNKGITEPTNAQLEAAARVIALWVKMHNIPLEFHYETKLQNPKGIIPHYCIADKACPGSNFPHQNFQTKINFYLSKWNNSPEFNEALKQFKNKNRVMPKI